jgi:hypothetical protein
MHDVYEELTYIKKNFVFGHVFEEVRFLQFIGRYIYNRTKLNQ